MFSVNVKNGKVRTLVETGGVHALAVSGDRVVYSMSSLAGPAELYSVGANGRGGRQLTHINAEQVAAARWNDVWQRVMRWFSWTRRHWSACGALSCAASATMATHVPAWPPAATSDWI